MNEFFKCVILMEALKQKRSRKVWSAPFVALEFEQRIVRQVRFSPEGFSLV